MQLDPLRRLMSGRLRPAPGTACEMCNAPIGSGHRHVVEVERRSLMCACQACSLLFMHGGAAGGRYRTVPDRYLALGPALSEEQWEELQIPVGIAFLFHSTPAARTVAFYPGPAGAAESLLSLEAWAEIVRGAPQLASLIPDVEAMLVQRIAPGGAASTAPPSSGASECFVVPVDVCYELVGRLKRCWKGFDGGEEARGEIGAFFANVRRRCGAEGT